MVTAQNVVRVLAEPSRLRVFCAIALGAATLSEAASAAGVPLKDAASALRRLEEGGLIAVDGDRLHACVGLFKDLARQPSESADAEDHGYGDERIEAELRLFVRGERLIGLPAQWSRKIVVLRHVAARCFEIGREYDEHTVNDKLRAWCEGSPVDHVSVRRYLVDAGILARRDGFYWPADGFREHPDTLAHA